MTTQSEVSRTIESAPALKNGRNANWFVIIGVTLILGMALLFAIANFSGVNPTEASQTELTIITARYQSLADRLSQAGAGPLAISIRAVDEVETNQSAGFMARYQSLADRLSQAGAGPLAISIRPADVVETHQSVGFMARYQSLADRLSQAGAGPLAISIRPVDVVETHQSTGFMARYQSLVDRLSQAGTGPLAISIRY